MLPGLADSVLNRLLLSQSAQSIVANGTTHMLGERAYFALRSDSMSKRVELAMRMMERNDVSAITIADEEYPESLRKLDDDAPPILFCRGRIELLTARSIAIVGARNSTEYGDSVAEMFATDIAQRGIAVVSGLARGIDRVAHMAALNVNGPTIAILGCGIDVSYPQSNAQLQERIAEAGLLVSEFAPGETAYPYNFPKRNRIIALLPEALLVIEAGPKSGTRKTVDWSLAYNGTVFAVPGPIGRLESQGTNEIIQEGGNLVTSVRDILETMHWVAPEPDATDAEDSTANTIHSPDARLVFSKLEPVALHIDEIARRAGRKTTETLVLLTQLELDGYVVQHPGKRFSRLMTTRCPARAQPAS